LIVPRWLLLRLMAIHPLNLVIYGAGETGRRFGEKIRDSKQFSLVGFLDGDAALRGMRCGGIPVLGSVQEVGAAGLDALGVNVVVVCVGPSLQETNAAALLRLPLHGIEVLNQGAFVEYYFKEISVEYANPHWFVSAPSLPGTPSTFAAKRVLSLALGTGGLLLSLPLWPLIALGIRLDSHGPVFFRQRRVGWRGRPFDIVKFRTMQVDAEKDGAQWTRENDPRITRFGRFLRVTRLDELPQLWNVVRGEMALVGPRPERPEFVAALAQAIPFYEQRHLVPPGVTGWAQIRYGYGASEEDARRKLEYDLYYIRHMSLGFDVEILFRTIPLIMKGSR
jgi:exopolysaccharide biosynthesis polyprenyl glycosylphosphotransferase